MNVDPFPSEQLPPKTHATRQQLGWLSQVVFQPRQVFAGVVAEPRRKSWLVPVVVVSLLIIAAALISTFLTAAPVSTTAISGGALATRMAQTTQTTRTVTTNRNNNNQGNQPPGGIPGGVPGGGFIQGNPGGGFVGQTTGGTGTSTTPTSTTPNIWLSLLWPVASFLITWLLLGGLTNVFSLSMGGHSNMLMALNIAAWSSIPIGVRNLAQILYYLASGMSIQSPGLSGFLTSTGNNALLVFAQFLLARVDIYLFWQIALLAVGVGIWGGLTGKKAVVIAVIAVVLVILLQSLVGLGVNLLGNVNINTGMLLRLR